MNPQNSSGRARSFQSRAARTLGLILGIALLASACGGDSDEADAGNVIQIGDNLELELPDDIDSNQQAGADESAEDELVEDAETGSTIPVTEEEGTGFEGMQSAAQLFNQCLTVAGYEFIGFNDPEVPASSEPDYLEMLGQCAAESKIVESMSEADDAIIEDPDAIRERNEGWIRFRECLIGRGWTVPEPVPDENGLVFRISDFADPEFSEGFYGPNGESFTGGGGGNSDSTACQEEAAAAAEDS